MPLAASTPSFAGSVKASYATSSAIVKTMLVGALTEGAEVVAWMQAPSLRVVAAARSADETRSESAV